MKAKSIKFFSPQENSEVKQRSKTKTPTLTGYISGAGKLVFPAKTMDQLDLNPEQDRFKIGTQEGKRKIKSLFIVPTTDTESDAFALEKSAKSFNIPLSIILNKGGIDYSNTKYTFTIKPFEYDAGVTGYELQLESQAPKAEYTGKPRGRKPKAASAS
jgi:hypothetical protein